jgi:ribosomal protein L35AE/L33A
MPILQIEHKVRDFDRWKEAFDNDPVGRQQGGVRRYRIARLADDPNHVLIELEFDSQEEAENFRSGLHDLWGRVGDQLGLEGPRARIIETVDQHEY